MLEEEGIHLAVASMGSIKPLDKSFLQHCVEDGYRQWISLEEHHQVGGLGSTLLEWLSDQDIKTVQLSRMGIGDHFLHELGSQDYVRKTQGLNAHAIVDMVQAL